MKKILAVILAFAVVFTPLGQIWSLPVTVKPVEAASGGACMADGSGGGGQLAARVGGVSLDQAATFLADMSDITGAYYDESKDRIVFVGKKNTDAPKFDKDDLAVAIKTIIFEKKL